MRERQPSLRSKLLFWLLVPNLIFWAAGGIGCFYIGRELTQAAYDDGLEDSLRTIVAKLRPVDEKVILDLSDDALETLTEDPTDEWYYSITDSSGVVIAGNRLFPPPTAESKNITFYDGSLGGESVRMASWLAQITLPTGEKREVTAQVAETMHARQETISKFLSLSFVLLSALVFMSSITTWFAMRMILAPLERLRSAVAGRAPADLQELDRHEVYREISPLIESINDLFSRLRREFDSQRQFLGDVAHTLRTRLAGVKLHSELGSRSATDEQSLHAFRSITIGISGLSRVVVKLLLLARVERNARETEVLRPMDLGALCREVVDEFRDRASDKDVALEVTTDVAHKQIIGSASGLRILIENLVDNAIEYTPPGGKIWVRLPGGAGTSLSVEDTGPEIDPTERENVFFPFYRPPGTPGEGSGLGLAIVKKIAEQHHAEVVIDSRPEGTGTSIRVAFPDQSDPIESA